MVVKAKDDGSLSLQLPRSSDEKPQFKTQPAHTHEVRRATQVGYDKASEEYKSSMSRMSHELQTYQTAVHQQVERASRYSPALPEVTEAKAQALRQSIDALQRDVPDVNRFGTLCGNLREATLACYQNNPNDALACSNHVDAFTRCVRETKH
jgi:hypothetical protein